MFEPRDGSLRDILRTWSSAAAGEHAGARLFVADDGGALLGVAFAEVGVGSELSNVPAVEISGIIVTAEARGKGIGKALVRAAAGYARECGVGWLTLKSFADDADAVTFWEGLGFSPRIVQFVAPAEDVL